MDLMANWLLSVPAFAVPFALAALGLIVTEKAGVLNLGAEGFMLAGAVAGVGMMLAGAGPMVALLGSILAGTLLGLLFAIMVAGLRIDHVIAGLALVFMAHALTSYIATVNRWTNQSIEGLEPVLFGQDLFVFLTPLIVLGVVYLLEKTRFGLAIRAVGENPGAADAAGIDSTMYRYAATLLGAALLGLAGGYLTVAVTRIWVDGVVGGRGWIAIALVIFARWYPWRALFGAVLFGAIEALIPRVAAAGVDVPRYFLQMTPYLATLGVMVWTAARGADPWAQPAALGRHHVREDRT
ncbi:MAG: ABC transporter permease [Pseudomonadota bacterium]